MDKDKRPYYYKIASNLRNEGINSECYTGDGGMKAQLKYADKRNARLAIIIGEDEVASNSVTIKDLFVGREVSDKISDNKEWRSGKDSQKNVPINDLVKTIKSIVSK
jgi:histidyl-tRNA synthetase